MGWSTRIALTMVALAVCASAAVGWFSYRSVRNAAIPAVLYRVRVGVENLGHGLEQYVADARVDLQATRASTVLNALVRARSGEGPVDGSGEAELLERVGADFEARMEDRPSYDQLRFLGANGRELVRVDRSGPDGALRRAPEAELQAKGDRPYFLETIGMAPDETYVSPIGLNQEQGVVDPRRVPVLRLATPVLDPSGMTFGVLVANVDMRPALEPLRLAPESGAAVYVVSEDGDFLLHPDPEREFGADLGRPWRIADELPELASAPAGAVVRDGEGRRLGVARAEIAPAGGPPVTVIGTVPYETLVAAAAVLGRTTLWAGLVATALAVVAAFFLARSLTRPLRQMTEAVSGFSEEFPLEVPVRAPGEVGVLARAFESMHGGVRRKNEALRLEVEERKRAEGSLAVQKAELERSNAELEQFAYVASHDLQEPLRMVASYTELLGQRYGGQLDDRADKYIRYAVDGARRMQQLVNDLLQYSRVGTQGRAMTAVDSGRVFDDVVAGMDGTLSSSDARVSRGELPTVSADEVQLGQVFQNLVGNAVKFRGDSAPEVRVECRDGGDVWRFSVADNGIGIDPAQAGRVFQMFQRLHGVGEYPGSGIGLAIVRKIVDRHGGRIWFESAAAAGTTFYFTLPKAEGGAAA